MPRQRYSANASASTTLRETGGGAQNLGGLLVHVRHIFHYGIGDFACRGRFRMVRQFIGRRLNRSRLHGGGAVYKKRDGHHHLPFGIGSGDYTV